MVSRIDEATSIYKLPDFAASVPTVVVKLHYYFPQAHVTLRLLVV
jgi:hypothetical protein